jgi:hypothetical protein
LSSRFLVALCPLVLCLSGSAVGQDEAAKIDKSRIRRQADRLAQFAPAGWKIEEQVAGDLNGDSVPDYALKLVEAKPEKNSEGDPTERGRALVLALATTDGKLKLAGVADSLLQCTRCGGAFYGVVESPANVKIEKGVVIVEQDHGSREVTDTTYRFRFDSTSGRFVLIGFDLTNVDRATASVVTESINYLTGVRVVTRGKGDKDVKTRTTIPKRKIYLEDASADDLESAAYKRLKL